MHASLNYTCRLIETLDTYPLRRHAYLGLIMFLLFPCAILILYLDYDSLIPNRYADFPFALHRFTQTFGMTLLIKYVTISTLYIFSKFLEILAIRAQNEFFSRQIEWNVRLSWSPFNLTYISLLATCALLYPIQWILGFIENGPGNIPSLDLLISVVQLAVYARSIYLCMQVQTAARSVVKELDRKPPN